MAMSDIQGPLDQGTTEDSAKYCTDQRSAESECETHARILVTVTVRGELFAGQATYHAWRAVAADRAAREHLYTR